MAVFAVTFSAQVASYESDVHFGLTRWLALRAGYSPEAADKIAFGNQLVDSGSMPFVDPLLLYACGGRRDDFSARRAGAHHFPSRVTIPAAPSLREVEAGGAAALKDLRALRDKPPAGRELLLTKFGEALHALQDSWAHHGTPGVPDLSPIGLECDPQRSWAYPVARGGPNSHGVDHTFESPDDAMRMAQATYDELVRFAADGDGQTKPAWTDLRSSVAGFVSARTKTEKARWFHEHGMQDDAFLSVTTLPDGPEVFSRTWNHYHLPDLQSVTSAQHQVDTEALAFLADFFRGWLGEQDMTAVAVRFGPKTGTPNSMAIRELAARLLAWRLRDHGRFADLAHKSTPLTANEIAALKRAARSPQALVDYPQPHLAFIPLLPRGQGDVSPVLPFFVIGPADADGKAQHLIAVAKFRHDPYDTLAVRVDKRSRGWEVTSVRAVVDH